MLGNLKKKKKRKINRGLLLECSEFEETAGAEHERGKQHFVLVISIWVLFYTISGFPFPF